jgi:hypothetical protein
MDGRRAATALSTTWNADEDAPHAHRPPSLLLARGTRREPTAIAGRDSTHRCEEALLALVPGGCGAGAAVLPWLPASLTVGAIGFGAGLLNGFATAATSRFTSCFERAPSDSADADAETKGDDVAVDDDAATATGTRWHGRAAPTHTRGMSTASRRGAVRAMGAWW